MAERSMDTLDRQLMNHQLTQEEYDDKCVQLNDWEIQQFHLLHEQTTRGDQ